MRPPRTRYSLGRFDRALIEAALVSGLTGRVSGLLDGSAG